MKEEYSKSKDQQILDQKSAPFHQMMNQLKKKIRTNDFEAAVVELNHQKEYIQLEYNSQCSFDQIIELDSLKAYCLINMNYISQAISLLKNCIQRKSTHSLSYRRLGLAYQKDEEIQLALKNYKVAQFYEPDNRNLLATIKKLESKMIDQPIDLIQKPQGPEIHFNNNQHVTFGSSQIYEIATNDSDEYFAIIKKQLTNLNNTPVKKSILKASKSLGKHAKQPKSSLFINGESEEKQQNQKKTKSLKNWNLNEAEKNHFEDNDVASQEKSQFNEQKDEIKQKKKKNVSFCFSSNND